MAYDRALTIFSPDGHLFQVEYAMEVVKKGTCVVAIAATDCIVFAIEKKSVPKLQDDRTMRKVYQLDQGIYATFSGLAADARILMNKAMVECASYRLNMEDPMSAEQISRYIAKLQQQYTQKGGARPFGLSTLIGGVEANGKPKLFLTDPSGVCTQWRANAIGRGSKENLLLLEGKLAGADEVDRAKAIRIAAQALLETVDAGARNFQVAIIESAEKGISFLPPDALEEICKALEKEKEQAEVERKQKATAAAMEL